MDVALHCFSWSNRADATQQSPPIFHPNPQCLGGPCRAIRSRVARGRARTAARQIRAAAARTVNGYYYNQVANVLYVANLTSGSLENYGAVTGLAQFSVTSSRTFTGTGITLYHGKGRTNRLALQSSQLFTVASLGETDVVLRFRVKSASGTFDKLRHKELYGDVPLHLDANQIGVAEIAIIFP